jgi:hypothetical protein
MQKEGLLFRSVGGVLSHLVLGGAIRWCGDGSGFSLAGLALGLGSFLSLALSATLGTSFLVCGILLGLRFSFSLGADTGQFLSATLALGLGTRLGLCGLHALGEALDLTSGVNNALLARVEGVADAAEVEAEPRLGRSRLEGISTRANDSRFLIVWVNSRLHV